MVVDTLQRVPLYSNDVFVDLGSGIGLVVFQVAALSNCKLVYGIEILKHHNDLAVQMLNEFHQLIHISVSVIHQYN